jgi:type I restriction enzyme S subunit
MGMTGDLGKVCRIYKNNLPALLNQRVGRVLFRDNKVDVGFLFNIFLSHNFQNRLASFFTGAAQKNISSSQVESIEILLPPLPEQQKIAEILESVDEEIDSVNSEIVKSEKLKRGLMEEFFKRRKEKGEKKKLGEIIEIESGQVDPKIFPYKNMILIAPNHIESDSRTILGKFTANQQNAISGKYFAKKGDVIYSKIRPYLKKVAMAQEDCLCSADMYPIRGKKETINKFLFYLLLSKDFTDYAISASSRTGIPKINREELNEYKLLLPSLEGQKQIAEILSAVDDKIQITKQLKNKLVQLKKGLMEDLLSGVTCV